MVFNKTHGTCQWQSSDFLFFFWEVHCFPNSAIANFLFFIKFLIGMYIMPQIANVEIQWTIVYDGACGIWPLIM